MKDLRVVIASPHARDDRIEAALFKHTHIDVLRIRTPSELEFTAIAEFAPRYIFFPHWSWIIPETIYKEFECVIFHMTDLPFGRGGSPLQNLILRGMSETQLTALRCVGELDAGPIYLKRPLSLLGTAEEILLRSGKLVIEMIDAIVNTRMTPFPQEGEPTVFRRRNPQQSNVEGLADLETLFDYIRMLDADGYPPAYLETQHFKLEFSRASLKSEAIIADVKISRKPS
jgi:methionyl-tRNA formyltransferase